MEVRQTFIAQRRGLKVRNDDARLGELLHRALTRVKIEMKRMARRGLLVRERQRVGRWVTIVFCRRL